MQSEWKQMLQDSEITENLQIGWENSGGKKGKLSNSLILNIENNFLHSAVY